MDADNLTDPLTPEELDQLENPVIDDGAIADAVEDGLAEDDEPSPPE